MGVKFHTPTTSLPPLTQAVESALPEIQPLTQPDTLENVVAFIKARGHCSATELMKAFRIPYIKAVEWLDALEAREIIHPCHTRLDGTQLPFPRKLHKLP